MGELLDVARTRQALEAVCARDLPGQGLPFQSLDWVDGDTTEIRFMVDERWCVLDLSSYSARLASDDEVDRWQRRQPRVVRRGIYPGPRRVYEVPSPDGRWFADVNDDDLWLRSARSDDSTRVTWDGTPEYGWDVEGLRWSPDSHRLALFKVDRRGVLTIPLVRWTLPDTPVESRPYSRAGEPLPQPELHVVDARDGSAVPVDVGDGGEPYLHVVGWHPDGREVYLLRVNRLVNHLSLLGVDPNTGTSRIILSERSETFLWGLDFLHGYTPRVAHLLPDGERVLWKSERDGLARLYMYSLNGDLEQVISPDSLDVDLVEFVDEPHGWIYFSARMLHAKDPYDIALYRAPLAGGSPERLLHLPQSWDRIEPTRSGDFFLVTRASIDQPPTLELRRADGRLVRELWRADLSRLRNLGWRPPERFTALAADGVTELHGLIFRPTTFDPTRSYPVLEDIYAGPQLMHTPRAMWWFNFMFSQWLAEHGFIVVILDGRGTPGRGKAFQDVVHGRFGTFEIADHAAALEQAAAVRPFMDLDRVGIFGRSWGGYFVLRALLTRPDLYEVGVASAPVVDPMHMRVSVEPYMGCLPADCPDAYEAGSNTALAGELAGKLLLIHGTRDDGAPFGESLRMVNALIAAGRPFDFLPIPEADHRSILGPYWNDVLLGYFLEHLAR
jgi:dipeptidyl aminopeptidase/acylaminoacyl peptidase